MGSQDVVSEKDDHNGQNDQKPEGPFLGHGGKHTLLPNQLKVFKQLLGEVGTFISQAKDCTSG
ncbi:MAG: hypothetical protein M3O09_04185 [Acidobacteriota bacterium]|nr:hypothetical protein [Acidobacteriota bacterium]